jgi:hypothetical protein
MTQSSEASLRQSVGVKHYIHLSFRRWLSSSRPQAVSEGVRCRSKIILMTSNANAVAASLPFGSNEWRATTASIRPVVSPLITHRLITPK